MLVKKPWDNNPPSHALLLHARGTATRRGTSLVPGFGTGNVPKIGSVFWKAIFFGSFFSSSRLAVTRLPESKGVPE